MEKEKLCIIAGGGLLPELLIQASEDKYNIYIISIKNDCSLTTTNLEVNITEVSKVFAFLQQHNITQATFAGRVTRPNLSDLKFDKMGLEFLAKITKNKFFGDNSLLNSVVEFFEAKNIKIIPSDTLMSNLLVKRGTLGNISPSEVDLKDIEYGFKLAKAIGEFDVGQGVIIENMVPLGVEGKEGTDNLIKRCATLKMEENSGILIKVAKPMQDLKIDLPAIGCETIINLAEAGFIGVALEADKAIIIDFENTIKLANERGIFIYGI